MLQVQDKFAIEPNNTAQIVGGSPTAYSLPTIQKKRINTFISLS